MRLVNLSNDKEICNTVNVADSFFKRLKGLMFTEKLDSGSGLYINPCQSVHTFFMNYAIDIIYLNDVNVVVAIDEGLVPGKVGSRFVDAKSVVELPARTVKASDTRLGNKLAFII